MSSNVPKGLPLVRKINHKIDMMTGDSLPNKETQRMTLVENEGLNKQVQELLRKGLTKMQFEVVGFNEHKTLYPEDPNFVEVWKSCKDPITLDIIR